MENQNKKSESAQREEAVLKFWKEQKVFESSLAKESPKGEYIFYEGPPTANGKPGIHHLEARAFKDVIPRYKTMQGFHVRRKGGWDTHGLPVELQVEKELGLKSKKEIEEYGIAAFNKKCKESVWTYVDLWEKFTERIGYWVDQEDPYVTYHNDYIESVWNVIKETNKQGLLYKDYKVVPWCPRCGTTLSSHELAQGYEVVKDLSVTAKFKIKASSTHALRHSHSVPEGQDSSVRSEDSSEHMSTPLYILAWTTTPWTLPGNVALAVGENIDYVKIKKGDEILILAKARLSVIEGEYKILEEMKGKNLIGLEYEPLYPFLEKNISEKEKPKLEKAFQVHKASFVTTEDGTGVVHTAVMYGQDDFILGNEVGLPKHHLVGLDGKFLKDTGFLEGRFVRDEEVAVDIIKDLAGRGLLFKKEKYEHSYPHCWRCHTALIYYARDSWYIKMTALRDKMVAENEGINWEPEHIKEGRFGEWLREIKDWAISRERYWGTPLPVWTCEQCHKNEVIGSIADLKIKTKKSGNHYFVMRHGESRGNVREFFDGNPDQDLTMTENGKKQVLASIKNFDKKIDVLISSTYIRTKQTTEIICKELGFPEKDVIYENKIEELKIGSKFVGKTTKELKQYYEHDYVYTPHENFSDGESFSDVVKRMGEFIYDLESKYTNKNIFIVGHGIARRALEFVVQGITFIDLEKKNNLIQLNNAEIKELNFIFLPHNENYELDLHKPYIDGVELICAHSASSGQACGGKLVRAKEVMDVWLDSGTMPFSQDHYPFDFAQGKSFENKNLAYPADFISEAIDQTRGWFYTLHAVGALMGRGKAYKNVICLGHLLDAKGKKMSKSLGNIVDPWEMIEKYGVDTLRFWMYSVNQPGESKLFDEKTVLELHRQIFGLLYNVLAFYELYRDRDLERSFLEEERSDGKGKSSLNQNILDQWIISRLDELINLCTNKIENYKLLEPARAIKDFIGDLSTWYLRRSRERIKGAIQIDKIDDADNARLTLYFVLKTLVKIMAPFAPFASEDIWQKLKNEKDVESVHLEKWPGLPLSNLPLTKGEAKEGVLEKMVEVRTIVSLGLEARQRAGLKVRQPLQKLEVRNLSLGEEYLEIIKEEINVKEVVENIKLEVEVFLATEISEELNLEGDYRELVRAIQDMRKKTGLTPSDVISLFIETDENGKKLIEKFESEIKKIILASKIEFADNNGDTVKIDELVFKILIEK